MLSSSEIFTDIVLAIATFPLVYYLIAIFSSWVFFRSNAFRQAGYAPPLSNLKPIRGIDPDAYENFASLCRQNYPEFELLFCVGSEADPAVPVLRKLVDNFPDKKIRIIFESGGSASNDKVAKLSRLVNEATYETLVINDSDVRVTPDYFQTVVAPLEDPKTGAVTCFYTSEQDKTFADKLHTVGMFSDFYAGLLVAKQLDGVKFALGKTIVTTRTALRQFGGFESLRNRPGDDLLVGRLIAGQGLEVKLIPFVVNTAAGSSSLRNLITKRLRWLVVMRHLRPAGHLGLLFTQGLAWMIAVALVRPGFDVAGAFFVTYLLLRVLLTWSIAGRGLKQQSVWRQMVLIPLWDLTALVLWLASFTCSNIRWRDGHYSIRNGKLVPTAE